MNIKHIFAMGCVGCGLAAASLLTACSDVEYEAATYSEAVTNLEANWEQGKRAVTLSWQNPSMGGQSGIQIIKDNTDITNLDEVVNSYLIKKAPTNVDVAYTVKARYSDGRVSEGQTVRFFVPYEIQKGGNKVAMLVPDDYATGSDDEKSAVEWFQKNYVNTNKGILVTPSSIDNLDIESQSACWVMCDRIGLNKGWENLPGGLANTATIEALKSFTADGGNLFLTNHATQLTVAVGRIADAYAPGIYGNGEGGQNNDVWGSQPIIGNAEGQIYDHSGHAIYRGMKFTSGLYERSIYCFEGSGVKGDHNCMWDLNAYGLAPNPNVVKTWEDMTNSHVLGTWNHVVDYCCAGIVEFDPTSSFAGRIIAVGLAAYEWNIGGTNAYQDQLEKFTSNCLDYVSKATQKVAMLVPNDYTSSADEKSAVEWFQQNYVNTGLGTLITPATIDLLDIEAQSVCWVMCDRIGIEKGFEHLPGDLASTETINALKSFTADGGNLLLTNHATQLTVAVGRIADAYAPGIYGNGEGGQNNDVWGSQPIIGNAEGQIYDHSGHDIYWGMNFTSGLYERSIYCFEGAGIKGDHNCMWDLNAYGLAPNPNVVKTWEDTTNSHVLGTWNHVVDYCCAGIVEFDPTSSFAGRIIAVGLAAYEWNIGGPNEYQGQLERFTSNCISYLK